MKKLLVALLGLPIVGAAVYASPTFATPDYEVVGDLAIQQIGNEIIGEFALNQTDTANSYDVLDEGNEELIGDLQLSEASKFGFFEIQPTSTPGDYDLVVEFHHHDHNIGEYTLLQPGNEITGDYQLAVDPPAPTPEPATALLSLLGIGCLAAGRLGFSRFRATAAPQESGRRSSPRPAHR